MMELYMLNDFVEEESMLGDTKLTIEIDEKGSSTPKKILSVSEVYYIEETHELRIVAYED